MCDIGSSSPEIVADVIRSNSYSLTRGGKVITSQPWSFNDSKGLSETAMRSRKSSGSSDSATDSDSSTPSSGEERPSARNSAKLTTPRECAKCDDDDDESSSSSESDSDETESTVIVRDLPPLTDEILLDDDRNPDPEGDPLNDTLGSISDDLSFNRERSPTDEGSGSPKSNGAVKDGKTDEDSQLSRSFEFYSELRDVTLTTNGSPFHDPHLPPAPPHSQSAETMPNSHTVPTSEFSRGNLRGPKASTAEKEAVNELRICERGVSAALTSRLSIPQERKPVGRPPPSPNTGKGKSIKHPLRKQAPTDEQTGDGRNDKYKYDRHQPSNGQVIYSNQNGTNFSMNGTRHLPSSEHIYNDSNSCPNGRSRNGDEIRPHSQSSDYGLGETNGSRGCCSNEGSPCPGRQHYRPCGRQRLSLSPGKFGGPDEADFRRGRSAPHEVRRGPSHPRHEDSELSDVSSGATSEDSAVAHSRYRCSPHKGDVSDWSSPMLTSLVEGHVTRLATPPDHRVASHLPPSCSHRDDVDVASFSRHNRPRPPPVPRPRTLEGSELVPCHTYSSNSSHHSSNYRSSLERNGKDSKCELSGCHRYPLRNLHPRDMTRTCWCEEEEEGEYESCDERHRHHRHSYHEGLHHAHLMRSPHSKVKHKRHQVHGGRVGRSISPCYDCRQCPPDSCSSIPRSFPYHGSKGLEERLMHLENDKESLQLQVSVLSDQVDAQSEKIQDLEGLLEQKRGQIMKTEEQLQKELMTRSSLETQRLELLSEISNLKLRQAATDRENLDLRDKLRLSELISPEKAKNQYVVNSMMPNFSPPSTSTPLHSVQQTPSDSSETRQHGVQPLGSPPPTSISILSLIPKPNSNPGSVMQTNNIERIFHRGAHCGSQTRITDWDALPPRTPPPNVRRKIEQFGTVPRQQRDLFCPSTGQNHLSSASTTGRAVKGVMFGKGFNQFISLKGSGKRSTSAPNLAETEKQSSETSNDFPYNPPLENKVETCKGTSSVSPFITRRSPSIGSKPTGIKKIFTRLRRSSSGHLENDIGEAGDLKRGGLRATATARLGWTSQTGIFREPLIPFSSWSARHVEEWLGNIGLSQYSAAARCFMESGKHISKATPHQLEKDVGVRHPLHRKKLQLAISNRMSNNPNSIGLACLKLDNAWVLRWLDDVALPQYKDVFSESRIDGLVLNYLTYDDLAFLKISNMLHITSLKRGIQVLRLHNFDSSVLKRRSSPEEEKQPWSPAEVSLWTNHRVMEWLKTVDLSEYAPNLRGSGVHGALMVYEHRFTSEFLASLLSISSTKTLLRRHLNTHFKELVGQDVVQSKREVQVSPGYIPLTTTAKIKMPRKSQFSLKRRKTKSEVEYDDLLCPLDELPPKVSRQYDAIKESSHEFN